MSFTLILCFLLLLALAGAVCLVIQGIQARSWKKILLPILGYLLLLVPLTRLSRYLEVRMSTVRQAC